MEVAIADARKALANDAAKLRQFGDGLEAAKSAAPLPAGATAAPAPTASGPPPGDHDVNVMVQRLADRLKKDGSDVQGWLQLVRSYRVIGQQDKMQGAIADARKALAGDQDKLKQFNAGVDAATSVAAAPPPPAARWRRRRPPRRRPASLDRPRPKSRPRRR